MYLLLEPAYDFYVYILSNFSIVVCIHNVCHNIAVFHVSMKCT